MYSNKNLPEIIEFLSKDDAKISAEVNITILRNIMLDPIEYYLKYLGVKCGLGINIEFGNYDNILQDCVSSSGLISSDTHCVYIFSKLDQLAPNLVFNFSELSITQIELEKSQVFKFIDAVIYEIRRKSSALIVWHNFEFPLYPSFGVIDVSSGSMQHAVIRELNEYLRNKLSSERSSYLIDMNLCISRLGELQFYDKRYWHIAKSPYSLRGVQEIAHESFKLIRALKGKNKKCIVLDCDNTLWGGIIGEDGINGIKLGSEFPGSAFRDFQLEILNLKNRGVLLALCSKNNDVDVYDVFDNHTGMVLKKEDISASRINWESKANNISEIAKELNIGLDSIVFVDDSDFEVNLVKQFLPEVEVIHLPKNQSTLYSTLISSCGYFDTLKITDEDKNRSLMYKSEIERKKFKPDLSTNMDEYLNSLNMKIEINLVDDITAPRVAQLTQKTNQFNLTTKRYSESEITSFCNSDEMSVISVKASDRFGDLGIIGVAILSQEKNCINIDTLLLSCRALGRGIESALIDACIQIAKKKKCDDIKGIYIRSPKNSQVSNFYLSEGFECLSHNDVTTVYNLNLENSLRNKKKHFNELIFFKKV